MLHRHRITEGDAYTLLSNPRRRETVAALLEGTGTEVTLRDLSERVATRETGSSPAPRTHRSSVYNALHQTHLPKLQRFEVVEYDPDRKLVRTRPAARSLGRYLDRVAWLGLTWDEYYRLLGIGSLCAVVAVLAELPYTAGVDALAVTTVALAAFALSAAYQLHRTVTGTIRALFR